jgi:hypothetical protein
LGAPISIHLIREMEVGSPKLLFENLDLTPIHSILWTGLHRHGPGRPVEYNPEWDLKALMIRQLEQIPYVKDLVKRLRRNPYLRKVCGYGDRAPCEAHFSQMKSRIGAEGFRIIEAFLRHEALRLRRSQPLSAAGLVQAACVDGTHLPAWSSRDPHDTRRGFGDPDARVGRGGKGFLLGYQSLFLVDVEGFPLGHVEAPLNVNEKELVEELLTRVLGECIEVELLAADSQLESQSVFDLLESLKMGSIIAWRRLKGRRNPSDVLTVKNRIDVDGPEWKRVIYKRLRAVVEGFNGRVKSRLAYERLTWQGLENAGIHVGLVLMVAYAVCIAAYGIGRPELRQSIAFFA